MLCGWLTPWCLQSSLLIPATVWETEAHVADLESRLKAPGVPRDYYQVGKILSKPQSLHL